MTANTKETKFGGNELLSKEEREELLNKRIEQMRKKNEELLKKHQLKEADRRQAELSGCAVNARQRPTSPPLRLPQQQPDEDWDTVKVMKHEGGSQQRVQCKSAQVDCNRRKHTTVAGCAHVDTDSASTAATAAAGGRLSVSPEQGPPPDPSYNFLSDRLRDSSASTDLKNTMQRVTRHKRNYGGEKFENVVHVMQVDRQKQCGGDTKLRGVAGSGSKMDVLLTTTGRERHEYKEWKQERTKIDTERVERQKKPDGQWKREWDLEKVDNMGKQTDSQNAAMKHEANALETTTVTSQRAVSQVGSGRFAVRLKSSNNRLTVHATHTAVGSNSQVLPATDMNPINTPLDPQTTQYSTGAAVAGRGRGRGRARLHPAAETATAQLTGNKQTELRPGNMASHDTNSPFNCNSPLSTSPGYKVTSPGSFVPSLAANLPSPSYEVSPAATRVKSSVTKNSSPKIGDTAVSMGSKLEVRSDMRTVEAKDDNIVISVNNRPSLAGNSLQKTPKIGSGRLGQVEGNSGGRMSRGKGKRRCAGREQEVPVTIGIATITTPGDKNYKLASTPRKGILKQTRPHEPHQKEDWDQVTVEELDWEKEVQEAAQLRKAMEVQQKVLSQEPQQHRIVSQVVKQSSVVVGTVPGEKVGREMCSLMKQNVADDDDDDDDEWEDVDDVDEGTAVSAEEEHDISSESFDQFIKEHTLKLEISVPNVTEWSPQEPSSSATSMSQDSFLKTPVGHSRVLDWGAEMDALSDNEHHRQDLSADSLSQVGSNSDIITQTSNICHLPDSSHTLDELLLTSSRAVNHTDTMTPTELCCTPVNTITTVLQLKSVVSSETVSHVKPDSTSSQANDVTTQSQRLNASPTLNSQIELTDTYVPESQVETNNTLPDMPTHESQVETTSTSPDVPMTEAQIATDSTSADMHMTESQVETDSTSPDVPTTKSQVEINSTSPDVPTAESQVETNVSKTESLVVTSSTSADVTESQVKTTSTLPIVPMTEAQIATNLTSADVCMTWSQVETTSTSPDVPTTESPVETNSTLANVPVIESQVKTNVSTTESQVETNTKSGSVFAFESNMSAGCR